MGALVNPMEKAIAQDDCLNEEWRPIPGWEDYYAASTLGRIKRIAKRNCGHIMKRGRLLKGYPAATLTRPDRKPLTATLHGLVAAAFIGVRPLGLEVNHKDGNKMNTRPDNVENVTPKRNKQHAAEMLLGYVGEKNGSAKLTADDVMELRRLYIPRKFGFHRLAKKFGVTKAAVRAAYYG